MSIKQYIYIYIYIYIYKIKKNIQTKEPKKKKKVTTVATVLPDTATTDRNLKLQKKLSNFHYR